MIWKFAYVIFKDRNLPYIVNVQDIREFHPESGEDFKKKHPYYVKWEKSDLSLGKEADFYEAHILCIGATMAEIEQKRLHLKLKKPLMLSLPAVNVSSSSSPELDVPPKAGTAVVSATQRKKRHAALKACDEKKKEEQSDEAKKLKTSKTDNNSGREKSEEEIQRGLLKKTDKKLLNLDDAQRKPKEGDDIHIRDKQKKWEEEKRKIEEKERKLQEEKKRIETEQLRIVREKEKEAAKEKKRLEAEQLQIEREKEKEAAKEKKRLEAEQLQIQREKEKEAAKEKKRLEAELLKIEREREAAKEKMRKVREDLDNTKQANAEIEYGSTSRQKKNNESEDSSSESDSDSDYLDAAAIKKLIADKELAENRLKAAYQQMNRMKATKAPDMVDVGDATYFEDINSDDGPPERPEADAESDGSHTSDEETIVSRIKNDLSGKTALPVSKDKAQVYMGSGVWIKKESWDKSLKLQQKDSLFCNDLPQCVWGKPLMQERSMSGRSASGTEKRKATPRKVKLCEAVFKGRLEAQGLPESVHGTLIKKVLYPHMGSAFYEAGSMRPPKPKKPKQKETEDK